jgi:hypothetical protein
MSDLARLDELIKRIDVAVTTPPADGSVAATELADETRVHTYDLAVMGMTAANDHLQKEPSQMPNTSSPGLKPVTSKPATRMG